MKAIRQSEFGPAESLRYEDVPDPEPAEGQVLLAVEAAGVPLIDTKALDRATELLDRGGRIVSYGWPSEQPSALDEDALRERGIEQSGGSDPGPHRWAISRARDSFAGGDPECGLGAAAESAVAGRSRSRPHRHRDPGHHGQGRPGPLISSSPLCA